jgi:hypothetical protein
LLISGDGTMFSSLLFNLLISGDGIMFSSTNQRVWGGAFFPSCWIKALVGGTRIDVGGLGGVIGAWDSC